MNDSEALFQRLAIITKLVEKAPTNFGRTALMKCLFFLKVLKGVPLPYSFSLYTYGPFDSDVLSDLQYAETLGAVRSNITYHSSGYQYEFSRGPTAEKICNRVKEFLSSHENSIEWVVETFGKRSASDLEMASTLIYVDRTLAGHNKRASIDELAKKVHSIKPHLSEENIRKEAAELEEKGLLESVV